MVKWLEELAHDCEVKGLIPATDKLFLFYICLLSALSKTNDEKVLATLIF